MLYNYKNILKEMFYVAVKTAAPDTCLKNNLPEKPKGRVFVIGAGKAAASMANTIEKEWGNDLSGIVITRYGHVVKTNSIKVYEAGHPLPDKNGIEITKRLGVVVDRLKKDENLICLFSGGGSALLTQPAPGITYEDKLIVNKSLLECGASISEINTVRKHLSAIKGGVLANRAFPATVFNFLISDVPGDNPSVIASGPTVPDETTFYDAKNIIEKYKINISDRVTNRLSGNYEETPKPGDKVFSKVYTQIIVRPIDALKAVEKFAKNLGFKTYILGDSLEGESRESAKWHAKIVREIVAKENPINQPIALFSGGETTVTLSKKGIKSGKGGRNTEFLLALAIELDLMKGIYALACDTDGIDGSEDNAGAIIGPDTMTRANHKNINAVKMLESNNSYGFFSSLGDLVVTGPTLTNVNDLRVILLT